MAVRRDELEYHAQRLAEAPRGQRAQVVARAAAALALSTSQTYRLLQAHRRRPEDGGSRRRASSVDDDTVRAVGALLAMTADKRNRVCLTVEDAREVAQRAGMLPKAGAVSASTLRRRLRDLRLDRAAQEAPDPAVRRISLHSNHTHVVDQSPARQWDLKPNGQVQHLKIPRTKPDQVAGRPHLWRYALVDHYSGSLFVRFYVSPGENAADMADFLWRAWSAKEHAGWAFRGVPELLVGDQGAPLKSTAIQHLLRAHGVQLELHAAGNAKASGAVETMHFHWEQRFEALLALQPAETLEQLNANAFAVCVKWNVRDTLTRAKMPRQQLWAQGLPGELRVPTRDRERWMRLASRDPETRKTDNWLTISWGAVRWLLGGAVRPQEAVTIVEHPFAQDTLRAWNAQGEELTVERLTADAAGFWRGSKEAVFGSGEFSAHKHGPAERLRAELERERPALPDVFGDPLDGLTERPLLPRHAEVPAIPEEALPPAPRVVAEVLLERAVLRLGGALPVALADSIRARVAAGVRADEVDQVLDELLELPAVAAG